METYKLTKKQQLYIEFRLANPTMADVKIGAEIGISESQICRWKDNPDFNAAFEHRLRETWKSYVVEAQERMKELMRSNRADVAYKATAYILDSNGYKATEKVEVSTPEPVQINIDYGED